MMIDMIVTRVEQHYIHPSYKYFSLIDNMCLESKNIYNYAN